MSWVKLDDRMPENIKIANLSDGAFRAYVSSICYAARELTDGFIPLALAKQYAGRPRVLQELVPALWQPSGKGFMIHDYLVYNPSREQVSREKEAARRRMFGRNSGEIRAKDERTFGRNSNSPVNPDPRPILPVSDTPIPQPPSSPELLQQQRPNIFRLYEQLLGRGVSPLIAERLKEIEQEWPANCVEHCFQEAAESNARNVKLVYAILERHKQEGCLSRSGSNAASTPSLRYSP